MKQKVSDDQILQALQECGGIRAAAARKLGLATRALHARLDQLRGRGVDVPESSYDGRVTGTSTLFGPDGETKLTWVRRKQDEPSPDEIAQAVREALKDIPRAPPVKAPLAGRKDLLAVYGIGDHHLGMYSWGEETGEDYDLKVAGNLLTSAIGHLTDISPPADEALIVDVGDFQHYDGIKAETTRNHNALDVDTRYHAMIRASLQLMSVCIEKALAKHRRVTVICSPGNHNDYSAAWMVEALTLYYARNPRVTVIAKAGKFHYYEFGKVLIGVTHGDTGKPERLVGVMAADQPEAWGRTTHRHWLTGHIHTKSILEMQGVTWETFRTLAARDAWANGKGYRSGRDMQCIVYHRQFGEVARHRFDVSMVEA